MRHRAPEVTRAVYERIINKYLRDCFAARTVARVSELAQLLEANRPHLSRLIPQLFGRTLTELLRERQLTEARRLLRVTPLGLEEIAAASAFGHRTTLIRRFREAYGETPTDYRLRESGLE